MKYSQTLPPVKVEAEIKEAVLTHVETIRPRTLYSEWLRRIILKELEANGIDPYKENES